MADHECVIGLIRFDEYSGLTTLAGLKEHISERIDHNVSLKECGLEHAVWLYRKEWTLKDYCDKRKRTNLRRFNHCPECGKKIDWKQIKESDGNG